MDTTAKGLAPFWFWLSNSRRGADGTDHGSSKRLWPAPPPVLITGTKGKRLEKCSYESARARSSAAARSFGSGDSASIRSLVSGWSKASPAA
jgi:hypothetical protein